MPGASAGINIAQRLGLNPAIIEAARARLGTQARDVGEFLDRLHASLREAEDDRLRLQTREQELEKEKTRLALEGKKEQQAKIREMEKKLESVLRDFEYHARESVNAIQDKAAAQKVAKDAERRIAKLRREFRDQFDSTVVAHTSGADQGDPHAEPQIVKYVSQGDTVKLKSTGRAATVLRKMDDTHFEVSSGRDEDEDCARRYCRCDFRRAAGRFSGEGGARARNFRLTRKRRRRTRPRKSTSSAST